MAESPPAPTRDQTPKEKKKESNPRLENKPRREIHDYFTPLNKDVSTVLSEIEKKIVGNASNSKKE